MSASGLLELVHEIGSTGSVVHVTYVTCGGLLSNIFCLPTVSVDFYNFYRCFCRRGVIENHRKAAGLIEVQSSVLCDLQVKNVNCIMIWSSRAPSWVRLWGHRLLRAMNYPTDASLRSLLCDHWGLLH